MTGSSWSRGPTTRTLLIGSGLSIEGTLELPHHEVRRCVDVLRAGDLEGLRLPPPLREDRLALLRQFLLRLAEDRGRPLVRLAPVAFLEVERLATGLPDDPVSLARRGLFHRADLALRLLDFTERFRFVQGGP